MVLKATGARPPLCCPVLGLDILGSHGDDECDDEVITIKTITEAPDSITVSVHANAAAAAAI